MQAGPYLHMVEDVEDKGGGAKEEPVQALSVELPPPPKLRPAALCISARVRAIAWCMSCAGGVFVLSMLLMAFLSAPEALVLQRPVNQGCYDHVRKTVHRGVVVTSLLGMEHTGHAFWTPLVFEFALETDIAHAAVEQATHADPDACQDANTLPAARLAFALRQDVAAMANESHLHLQLCSWPCGGSGTPDVHLVAKAAEAAGLDYRALLLLRNPAQTMYWWDVGRAAQLATECFRLREQLFALDPAFYTCLPYANDQALVDRAQRFLGVNTSFTAHDHWHGSTNHVHDQEHYDAMTSQAKIVFGWYQDCMHDMVDLCADQEHLEWQEDWRASRIQASEVQSAILESQVAEEKKRAAATNAIAAVAATAISICVWAVVKLLAASGAVSL